MAKTLLCVDKSRTVRKMVEMTFARTEFMVICAQNSEEALAMARGNPPDIVLADGGMEGLTGYELCRALRAHAATREIPVLILVGANCPYDDALGKLVGADGYVAKPWDTQSLLDQVSALVDRPVTTPTLAHEWPLGRPPMIQSAATKIREMVQREIRDNSNRDPIDLQWAVAQVKAAVDAKMETHRNTGHAGIDEEIIAQIAREVVERVAREVIPPLAETILRERKALSEN